MNGKLKKLTAFIIAGACAAAIPLAACNKTPEDSDGDEGYSVVLNYNDSASRPRLMFVEEGGSLSQPANPLREGYEIDYWSLSDGGEKISFPYTPSGDVTLYANWKAAVYPVTFDWNFEGSVPAVEEIEYNAQVNAPAQEDYPENPRNVFFSWNMRSDGLGEEPVFPYTVRREVTFYAQWIPDDLRIFNISFDANYEDAEEIETTVRLPEGTGLQRSQLPELETRSGYTFRGWALSSDATRDDVLSYPYIPDAESASDDITLYAVWTRAAFNIRFRTNYVYEPSNGNDILQTFPVSAGDILEEEPDAPDASTLPGFTFDGWYSARIGGDKIEFPYTATGRRNIEIYAHWVHDLVETKTFDAEFTFISDLAVYYGHSGEVHGTEIIMTDDGGIFGASTQPYPADLGAGIPAGQSKFISYLSAPQVTVEFNIYSETAVSGATLYANLAAEEIPNLTFTPEGEYGFKVTVNEAEVDYGQISFVGDANVGGSPYASRFKEVRLGSVNLNAGWNSVKLIVNNTHAVEGSTMQAIGPRIDYIRLDTDATLSWHPEYGNLYRSR